MKIGILTLVNQLNYGGVLQAYALQAFLKSQGYAVEVIDYWLSPTNRLLLGMRKNPHVPFSEKLKKLLMILCRIDTADLYFYFDERRYRKTQQFLREKVTMSPTAYKNPEDLKKIEGYNCLVVGSDQVWHTGFDPNPFLLNDMVHPVCKVSYAASLGVKNLPENRVDEYSRAWKDFHAIGVREKEGKKIVEQTVPREATWVVDPTLLLSQEKWLDLCQDDSKPASKFIFCYWIGNIDMILPYLQDCVAKTGYHIRFYTNVGNASIGNRYKRRIWVLKQDRRIQACYGAGPTDFLAAIRDCEGVISDSFHAFMFSCIFRKKGQFFNYREGMAARLSDFAKRYGLEKILFTKVPSAFSEFLDIDYDNVWRLLNQDIDESKQFLLSAIGS